MSIHEVRDSVTAWTRRNEAWGEAILIDVRRTAPRAPGARYVTAADGTFAGNLSSGCVEADLQERLLELLAEGHGAPPRRVTYGISDEEAAGVGLSCGGEIDVLLLRHEAGEVAWEAVLERLGSEDRPGTWHGALLTSLSEEAPGAQLLVDGDGAAVGSERAVSLATAAAECLPLLFAREGSETMDLPGFGAVFVDRLLPARQLVIVGATAIGAALARLAPSVGYRVIVVEPREGLARSAEVAGADVRVEWPAEALESLGAGPWTDVAVLAHDERLDVPALRVALRAGCRYVGLLGGRRTQRVRRQALLAEGLTAADVDRIHGPIGLDLGAELPSEVAVAILAEMVAVRRLGTDRA